MDGNELGDGAAIALADGLRQNRSLTSLNLNENGVGAEVRSRGHRVPLVAAAGRWRPMPWHRLPAIAPLAQAQSRHGWLSLRPTDCAAGCARLPLTAPGCHKLPSTVTNRHRLPLQPTAADCHRLPPTATDCDCGQMRLPPPVECRSTFGTRENRRVSRTRARVRSRRASRPTACSARSRWRHARCASDCF